MWSRLEIQVIPVLQARLVILVDVAVINVADQHGAGHARSREREPATMSGLGHDEDVVRAVRPQLR